MNMRELGGTFVTLKKIPRRRATPSRYGTCQASTTYTPEVAEEQERINHRDKLHRGFVPIDDVTDEMARAAW